MTPEGSGSVGRLVDDVRRLGIDVAADIAGRFARMVAPLDPGTSGLVLGDGRSGRLAGDVFDAVAATLRVLEDLAEIAGAPVADGADGRERLVVPVAAPGTSGAVPMWLHNTTAAAVSAVSFTTVDLVGSAGRLPSAAVSFDPVTINEIPAGTGRQVMVTVTVPLGSGRGVYHGLVVASGLAATTLALRVDVGPDGGTS